MVAFACTCTHGKPFKPGKNLTPLQGRGRGYSSCRALPTMPMQASKPSLLLGKRESRTSCGNPVYLWWFLRACMRISHAANLSKPMHAHPAGPPTNSSRGQPVATRSCLDAFAYPKPSKPRGDCDPTAGQAQQQPCTTHQAFAERLACNPPSKAHPRKPCGSPNQLKPK